MPWRRIGPTTSVFGLVFFHGLRKYHKPVAHLGYVFSNCSNGIQNVQIKRRGLRCAESTLKALPVRQPGILKRLAQVPAISQDTIYEVFIGGHEGITKVDKHVYQKCEDLIEFSMGLVTKRDSVSGLNSTAFQNVFQ